MQIRSAARMVFIVRNFQFSLEFYRDLLGLQLEAEPGSGWACFDCGGMLLCLCAFNAVMPYEEHTLGSSPDQLLFEVDSIEEVRSELIRRGVDVKPVQQMSSTVRIAEFRDPDGRYLGLEERS
ncbi:MAG: VOC family protein [Planctomycetales bacterium]|nr:VOC family protein [bacterium]UNM09315.1 MAG: VOC family protein [Planctomycetales bacterium]